MRVAPGVDRAPPLAAVRDPVIGVVGSTLPDPLHVVGKVRAVERILREDPADTGDGDVGVANVARPAQRRREVLALTCVLEAAGKVVPLLGVTGHDRDRDHARADRKAHPQARGPPKRPS